MEIAASPEKLTPIAAPPKILTIYPSRALIWTTTFVYLALLAYSAVSLPQLRDFLGLEVGVFIPVWRVLVVIGGVFVILCQIWRRNTVSILGEKEISCQRGIFSKSMNTIPLARISNLSHDQAWWKRILGVSDVSLITTGDQPEVIIPWISNSDAAALIASLESNPSSSLAKHKTSN